MTKRWHPLLLMAALCPPQLFSQEAASGQLSAMAERLHAFGRLIPQEKVYIHMDNTSYFQGDTIWFAAYTRQTNTGTPSQMSGVLYVELLNHEGYLAERRLVEMKNGRGDGYFVLNYPVMYSGFYELRAYTRWQLNWGVCEHRHSRLAAEWFLNKTLEKEFYRDYEKLYSRVFPVYDRPADPAHPATYMTTRTMRRKFKDESNIDERKRLLTFFPEGGDLLAGVPGRVAFEAAWNDGEWLEGTLEVDGQTVAAVHRGRGVCTVTPQAGKRLEAVFRCADGTAISSRLPEPKTRGAALRVQREGDRWRAEVDLSEGMQPDSVGLTLMREGNLCRFHTLEAHGNVFVFNEKDLKPGVHQLTVFDTAGRVLADRLFFVSGGTTDSCVLAVRTDKETYAPYERINLSIESRKQDTPLSVAVRDRARAAQTCDNGNILTEMLLASEIRGFVPEPGWYFEKDDDEHRLALDLLMMTQGWRRFAWQDMAVKGRWELSQPAEKAPILTGEVYDLNVEELMEEMEEFEYAQQIKNQKDPLENTDRRKRSEKYPEGEPEDNKINGRGRKEEDDRDEAIRQQWKAERMVSGTETETWRRMRQGNALKRKKSLPEVKVRAEMVTLEEDHKVLWGEVATYERAFNILLPRFYGDCVFFLGAADTVKWSEKKKKRYNWVELLPRNYLLPGSWTGKFAPNPRTQFVRLAFPYPNFVKKYSHYQCHPGTLPADSGSNWTEDRGKVTQMDEVLVDEKWLNGLRPLDETQPACLVDAYEARNRQYDAGMLFAPVVRVYVGDYGLDAPYVGSVSGDGTDYRLNTLYGMDQLTRTIEGIKIPEDSAFHAKYLRVLKPNKKRKESISYLPPTGRDVFSIAKYGIYTDYSPRLEGSIRYAGSNLPETNLVKFPFPNESMRVIYRDRHYVLPGFSYPKDFYNPDYSRHTPPDSVKDYRRTLYWNANVMLDKEGKANITLYNNARATTVTVDAAGQAKDGTLLWGRE